MGRQIVHFPVPPSAAAASIRWPAVQVAEADSIRLPAARTQPRIWPLFFVFLALIAVLRIPTFSNRVFNSDEAYLATQAQVLVDGGHLYVDTVDRKPPVVPYLYAMSFALTGSDDLGPVRVLAVLAHALTALLLAAEARRRFIWRGAALAAGLLYLLSATAFFPADAQAANFEVFMLPVMTGAVLLGIRGRLAAVVSHSDSRRSRSRLRPRHCSRWHGWPGGGADGTDCS